MAEWLLQNGAEWHHTDKDGKDALTLARDRGHKEVAALIEEWAAAAAAPSDLLMEAPPSEAPADRRIESSPLEEKK